MGLQVRDRYCEHIPDRVINVKGTTGMWDVPFITDRTVLANRPDAMLRDKTEKICLLVDKAIPCDPYFNTKASVDKKNQLDVTICILYFSSNICSTCFGQSCTHHQELTTA